MFKESACLCVQNQVQREITHTLKSLPWISIPTVAIFFAEVRGYSKLYDNIEDSPYGKKATEYIHCMGFNL